MGFNMIRFHLGVPRRYQLDLADEIGLLVFQGIDWSWQSMDGAMTKAPLGGGKNRPKPYGSGQTRRETKFADGSSWGTDWLGH